MVKSVNSINLDNLRECCPLLPCRVGRLWLYTEVPPSDYGIFLDDPFWICHPRTSLVETTHEAQQQFFKWLYINLKKRDVTCCNSPLIKVLEALFKRSQV